MFKDCNIIFCPHALIVVTVKLLDGHAKDRHCGLKQSSCEDILTKPAGGLPSETRSLPGNRKGGWGGGGFLPCLTPPFSFEHNSRHMSTIRTPFSEKQTSSFLKPPSPRPIYTISGHVRPQHKSHDIFQSSLLYASSASWVSHHPIAFGPPASECKYIQKHLVYIFMIYI